MIGFLYRKLLKPILFCFPADAVHDKFIILGQILGRYKISRGLVKRIFCYKNQRLETNTLGLKFDNPIGLSAGFDYDGKLAVLMPSVGFGFATVGTVTRSPYSGNPKPMLGRLPKSKALLVNKGFKNAGIENILPALPNAREAPLGLSIGPTNKEFSSFKMLAEDIYESFALAEGFQNFDYYELNTSCPNLLNTEHLEKKLDTASGLEEVLKRLSELKIKRPLFLKMPLERGIDEMDEMCRVAERFEFVRGLIFANLLKNRNHPDLLKDEVSKVGEGNFSGAPTRELSNELISWGYKNWGRRFAIVGSGGVFNAKDAYEKIKRGASLVQIITGMIFEGPQVVSEINRGLLKLLEKDGFKEIKEAVGSKSSGRSK